MKRMNNGSLCRLESWCNKRAFTLIELLAVIATLGFLTCVLMPALARTSRRDTTVECLNNFRQVIRAWVMYAEDNNEKLVYNRDGGNVGRMAGSESWVGGWMDYSTSPDNTNTALLVLHERYAYAAYLGPYLKSPRPFRCPVGPGVIVRVHVDHRKPGLDNCADRHVID